MKQDLCLAKSPSILLPNPVEVFKPSHAFELSCEEMKAPTSRKVMRPGRFASASASLSEGVLSSKMTAPSACPPSAPQASTPKVRLHFRCHPAGCPSFRTRLQDELQCIVVCLPEKLHVLLKLVLPNFCLGDGPSKLQAVSHVI
jgi:hypothetical protein